MTTPVPLELVIRGKDEVVALACPKCGALFTPQKDGLPLEEARERATAHCQATCACGKPLDKSCYYTRCSSCDNAAEAKKEQARFEKAIKLSNTEYGDPVYWEGHVGGLGDGYFTDLDELAEYCEENELEPPEYVWACTPHEFILSAERLLEHELEGQEMYEGAADDIHTDDRRTLQDLLNVWVKTQELVAWKSDHSRAVVLTSPLAEALEVNTPPEA